MANALRRRPSDVHKDIACCLLRTSQGDAQCVIASTEGRHVLITNHHVLPTQESIKGCSLVVGRSKPLQLKEGLSLYSCCGPNSAWPTSSIHVPLPGGEKAGCCPREEDWTAVILDDDFARKLASTYKMTFPILRLYERDDTDTAISIFERSKDGEIKLHNFNLNGACQNEGKGLERDVNDHLSRSRLRYPCTPSSDIGSGCSGAPIFVLRDENTPSLVGIHCSSPGPNSDDTNHVGLSIDFIISSLYCECSLVSTLAFLRYMVRKLKSLPPAVVLNGVSCSIDCQKKHQCEELKKFEDAATQFKEERRKYFLYNIDILELVLSEMQMNSSDFFKFASSRDGQSTMKLLAALFSMFDSSVSSDINEVFGCKKDGGGPLEDHIKCLCQELLRVLKDNRQSSPVIKVASELLSALLNFSSDQGPACCFLETPNIRILGTIAQSSSITSDVGTMQAYYTAYLKSSELAHQGDMARTRLEGEKKCEAAEKTIAQLRDRENDLMSQLEEKKQKYEELETICEQQALALEQLRDVPEKYKNCTTEKVALNEENEELARKIITYKQEIEELRLALDSSVQHPPPDPESCSAPQYSLTTTVTQTQETLVLQDKATSIAQYMNTTEITPHLSEKRLLTQSQLEYLHSLPETKAKNMYIVLKVGSQGRKAVLSFIECLWATAYDVPAHGDLANALESLL